MLIHSPDFKRVPRKPKRPKMRLTPEDTVSKAFHGSSDYVRNNYPEECARFFVNRRLHRCSLHKYITEECADLINLGREGAVDKINSLGWDYSWADFKQPVGAMLIMWEKDVCHYDPLDVWEMTRKQRKLPLKPLIACYERDFNGIKYLKWFAVSDKTRARCKTANEIL